MDIVVNGSGWAPNQTYPLTVTGPNLNGQVEGQTAITNADGVISSTVPFGDGFDATDIAATTSDPPTPGTYSITMDGVTGSYTYAPPEAITVWSIDYPNFCPVGSTTCTFPIQFIATGFTPDTTYPETTTWNGTIINQTSITTNDTGSVPLLNVGTTTPPGSAGTATVTFGGATASLTIVQSAPTPTTTIAGGATIAPGTGETITVTPTNPPASDASSAVTFTVTGVGGFTGCGTIGAATASGTTPYPATSTYTAGGTSGFCTIAATEGGVSGSLTVDQT